jgi:hypothetical protein
MKHSNQRDEPTRFSGGMRHYHRAGSQNQRSWEEWVDGKGTKARGTNWLKIAAISVFLLALCAIVAGLIIELLRSG